MDIPPIDQLVFKGTHNSYECIRHAPPAIQVDHYGAWAIELDFGVPNLELRRGNSNWNSDPPRLVVGHDGPGESSHNIIGDDPGVCWANSDFLLRQYLDDLAGTEALHYRPLLLYLDKKLASDHDTWDPLYDDPAHFLPLLEADLQDAFGDAIFGPVLLAQFRLREGRNPTVPELAGRILPISTAQVSTNTIFRDGTPIGPQDYTGLLSDRAVGGCDIPIEFGVQFPPLPNSSVAVLVNSGFGFVGVDIRVGNVYRTDNISSDWTFALGVPPNPLIVSPDHSSDRMIVLGCNDSLDDIPQASLPPQGTRLVPYSTLVQAVSRARGEVLPGVRGIPQTGFGFTVLVSPGLYADPVVIDFPLTLRFDDPGNWNL